MEMGDHVGRPDKSATEELILRTIAAHADSLLRTARRHSICLDDAQDAYQRGLEIFMRHADRLDPGRAGAWLHTVVKREAKALRRSRQKLVGSEEIDLDSHQARHLPTPEEQLLSFDMVSRSAEALQRLKPQELRALWLKAQGHSYNDIGAITGWSYTKVNRCIAEGRESFLERYAGIESGEECDRWLPTLSAMIDGQASQAEICELRPHLRNCPGCRGRLKAMRNISEPLAAVLPLPLAAAVLNSGEPISNVLLRAYETITGDLHDRAAYAVTKVQALFEVSAVGKVTAVAASAAAVAGGGYVSVEQSVSGVAGQAPASPAAKLQVVQQSRTAPTPARTAPTTPSISRLPTHLNPPPSQSEFPPHSDTTGPRVAPEFAGASSTPAPSSPQSPAITSASRSSPAASPEFTSPATAPGAEFGP